VCEVVGEYKNSHVVIPNKQDGLVAMVLVFFEGELENAEPNIAVTAKKKKISFHKSWWMLC